MGSNYCLFSSVVEPVRSFTSISRSEILDLFPSDLISLTLNTRVNFHWYVWVSLLSWSFTESSGGLQLTSTPSRSVTSCSLQKKATQEMIEVMSWYESWICMQIILVLIPPRQSAAFDFGGPPVYSTSFCKSPANCSMPPVWPFKALFEFACINCLTKSIIRWEEQSSLFALLYWYALPLKTVAIMSQNFRP